MSADEYEVVDIPVYDLTSIPWVSQPEIVWDYYLSPTLDITYPRRQLHEFNVPKLSLEKATFVTGRHSIGKTEYALAHGNRPVLVTHLEDLANVDFKVCDLVVFELPLETLSYHVFRALLDTEHPRTIISQGKPVAIPIHVKRIFTHLVPNLFNLALMDKNEAASLRRMSVMAEFKTTMY